MLIVRVGTVNGRIPILESRGTVVVQVTDARADFSTPCAVAAAFTALPAASVGWLRTL
ncbi:hypothetical protein [Vibrio sp. 2025]|uniref:hypothetical protein n=1 Tax=Vibrio sp. 2025 TaxID=3074587 RepID=UPI002964F8EE|nr:hypothetical protein [Vibrio sp. 2025]